MQKGKVYEENNVIGFDIFYGIAFWVFSRSSSILDPNFISVRQVMNGSKTSVIGERAIIWEYKEELKTISAEKFDEFLLSEIDGKDYNWFTIGFLEDGTGIVFTGCDISMPVYGDLTAEGMISETIGFITRSEDNGTVTFEYSES